MKKEAMNKRRKSVFVLYIALFFSLFLPLSAPYISLIRNYLRFHLGGYFDLFLLVFLSIAGAVVSYLLVRGFKRSFRFSLIGLSLMAGALILSFYFIPDIVLIEGVHFIEYGVLTLLFIIGLKPDERGIFSIVAAVSLSLLVSLADETVQFLVSSRVGELRDLLLNFFAVVAGCGLTLVATSSSFRGKGSSRFLLFISLLIPILLLSFFLFAFFAERGYVVRGDGYLFRSRFPKERLVLLAKERGRLWLSAKERFKPRLLGKRRSVWEREDYYLTEAQAHTRIRNEFKKKGDFYSAYFEDRILMDFYLPYLLATDQSWGRAERLAIEKKIKLGGLPYRSKAFPHLIVGADWCFLFFFLIGVIIVVKFLFIWVLPRRLKIIGT